VRGEEKAIIAAKQGAAVTAATFLFNSGNPAPSAFRAQVEVTSSHSNPALNNDKVMRLFNCNHVRNLNKVVIII